MPKTRNHVAAEIAASLADFERSMDDTITMGSQLVVKMLEGRKAARLAPQVGHEALDRVVNSIASLVTSRAAMIAGHAALDDTRKGLGLVEVATGDKYPDPQVAALRLVG